MQCTILVLQCVCLSLSDIVDIVDIFVLPDSLIVRFQRIFPAKMPIFCLSNFIKNFAEDLEIWLIPAIQVLSVLTILKPMPVPTAVKWLLTTWLEHE